MLNPNEYKQIYIDMDIQQLIMKKNTLIKSIEEYEKNYILGNKKIPMDVKQNPKLIYKYHVLYLKEIMDLILEKVNSIN